jgi:hypothetical protein
VDERRPARERKGHPVALARQDRPVAGPAARLARRSFLALAATVLAPTLGCNQRAIESWLQEDEPVGTTPSLYSEPAFGRAIGELRRRVAQPVQALSLLVYSDRIVLQAKDPASSTGVVQYVYRAGVLAPPVSVKLLGGGKLDDNLFPLDAAKLDAIPRLAREAKTKSNIPEGTVSRVLLKRNLPESMDIQFRVFVTSQRRDAALDADRNGVLIDSQN